jgi:DNA invertase Pin-like site-specific DNA recombinase
MSHPKVRPTHLNRSAVIYVRQSSPQAVEQHAESRRRQYQLVEQAQQLGWKAGECIVIDDDQGISGAQSYNRPGYQRLVSMLALREVGIVLGLEVSRLARNSLDWYQLLELAAAFDVLIADEDGVYDPGQFNDRLLLGLKGTISEVELYQIRCRMVRGRLNKAARGEFALSVPVGMDWDPAGNKPRLAVDQSMRHALDLVFHIFGQLHSIRGVLYYFREANLELPYQRLHRGLGREIGWRRPSYDALYSILTNPVYAGIYCYGRRERQVDPLTKTVHVRKRARSEWEVFLPDHHPGYITLAEFEENQRVLENNRRQFPQSQGASGRGPALLQGLVFCQHCGRKMRICYRKGSAYYVCDAAHRRYGEPICNRASTQRVDALVEELFLTVVNAETLELSMSYAEKLRQEAREVDRVWQEKFQRLEYEANLARRRYELVDPENRLVAHTLETEWNERLLTLEEAKKTYEVQRVTSHDLQSTLEQMQHIITHLPGYWYADSLSMEDRKDLLRCLVEQVFLESRGKVIRAHVNWYGGAVSELDVPKYLFSAPHIYHRIRDLAGSHTDAEIADALNQEGVKTVKGRPWTARRVMDFRLSNAIPSGFTMSAEFRMPDSGYITSAEAAVQLGVSQSTIQKWYRLGVLSGKQDSRQALLWIEWTDEVTYRLGGGATPDPRMVSVRSLCTSQEKRPDQVLAWAQASGHTIYRLRRNSAMRFFVLPGEPSVPQK